jgi:hypothetical protein
VRDDDVVDRLHKTARHDWKNSHPLDLSDEGLMADLEDRQEGAAEELAIESVGKSKKKSAKAKSGAATKAGAKKRKRK